MQISLAGGGFQKVTRLATLALIGHTIDAALDLDKGTREGHHPVKNKRSKKQEAFQLVSSNVTSWGSAELQFDAWASTDTHDLAPHKH
eukprot:2972751-Amphidinium_carterae.1